MSDVLTNSLNDRDYEAVYLENEYLRICVLPEIGGRIFEALDKVNGYDFFYKQNVIKPALIGMLGAWMSGGVEWNFPHHHRANTFMPMDYTIQRHDDGRVTLWLTEIERRHRMKMLLGLTIWPDQTLIEAEFKFFNRTPFVHSFLYFANPAVHVDSTYQVLFPPEVEYVTQHAKREFAQWPIADTRYGGYNYDQVDISWWKNLPKPVSFFAWDHQSDYFAGYNHGLDAGVAYVANHYLAPGKKFFTFGCGDQGQMWDKMLTDSDGPYLELMAGAYSDNQPDYSWIQPFETKTIKQIWFPLRDLGGMSFADRNGALYLTVSEGSAELNIQTTGVFHDARVQVKAKENVIYARNEKFDPHNTYQSRFELPEKIREQDLEVTITDGQGETILYYQPPEKNKDPMPEPVSPPRAPQDYTSTEELYLTGLRLDEFYNPQVDSYPYYEEALARDSNDVRVNTQLGILYCKGGQWAKAEKVLQRAVDRLTANYTRPKTGEALYYLGLVQRALDKPDQAYDSFYRAAWNFGWRSPAYYELAELDGMKSDLEKAMYHLDQALATNVLNTKALNFKTVALRQLGRLDEARKINDHVLTIDPLDYWALTERSRLFAEDIFESDSQQSNIPIIKSDRIQLALECATDYANAGFIKDAVSVLEGFDPKSTSPLVAYYFAYFHDKLGDEEKTIAYLNDAHKLPYEYCFPYRLETLAILKWALNEKQHPRTFYYLGNLLFDHQPERAIELWENTVSRDTMFSPAYRNLGFGYFQTQNNLTDAIAMYERAIALDSTDARLFYELDVVYQAANVDIDKRFHIMQRHHHIVEQRDDALSRLTELYVQKGKYDTAIDILKSHHFNVWEGGGNIHQVFVDAHLLRGLEFFANDQLDQAEQDFNAALTYPDNLEVGRPTEDIRTIRTFALLGILAEHRGDLRSATDFFKKATILKPRNDYFYFQGLAFDKLGETQQAENCFNHLVEQGKERLDAAEIDFFAKFGERGAQHSRQAFAHYLMGLGYLGQEKLEQAKEAFTQSYNLNNSNVWVQHYLNQIKD